MQVKVANAGTWQWDYLLLLLYMKYLIFFVPFAVSTVLRLKEKKEKVINNQQKNTIKLQNVKKINIKVKKTNKTNN